jgi:hypothetical protein
MSWIGALKKWNDKSPCWCVPRKGTKQHDDVKSIMNKKIEAVEAKAEVAMKIPMEPQRKSMSESNVPKAKFHEHVPAPEETEEGKAIESFGHFMWRRFDGGEIKGKNYRRTAGQMYAMDLVDVKDRFSYYWKDWNPIIGLVIPGVSGKARATCKPDGTISFTNIMLEKGEEASHSAIDEAIVKEYREYGVGDLQPRYEKIAKALTTFHEPVPAPEKKTSAEIHQDNLRRTKEKEEKIKSADEELKQLMAEALEASKEGGKFKRRDNWKGKAGYMKKIDNLWKKYPAGIDRFRRAIPFDFGWSPS